MIFVYKLSGEGTRYLSCAPEMDDVVEHENMRDVMDYCKVPQVKMQSLFLSLNSLCKGKHLTFVNSFCSGMRYPIIKWMMNKMLSM